MRASQQAAAAYRASQTLDSRPAAVLAGAHQQLAASFAAALSAYQARALDRMCRHNELSVHILTALIVAVEGRSAEADELAGRYRSLQLSLNRMLVDPTEIDAIRSGHNWLCDMARAFRIHLR